MFHVKHSISHTALTDREMKAIIDLEKEYSAQLHKYAEQLLWWNERVNLVSREVSRETISEHIRHSLLISVTSSFKNAKKVIDTGTGGGLPGLPLAVCYTEKHFILNDIVTKKLMAVKQMGLKLKLHNAEVLSGAIENVEIAPEALIISKHAFKADDLIGYLSGKPWKSLVFLKGAEEAEAELNKVKDPLGVRIIHLDKNFEGDFYKGKAVVEVERKENE